LKSGDLMSEGGQVFGKRLVHGDSRGLEGFVWKQPCGPK
jgi:hypothetical protein